MYILVEEKYYIVRKSGIVREPMDGWLGLEPSCIITKKCVLQIIKVTSKCTNERRKFFPFDLVQKRFSSLAPLKKFSIAIFAGENRIKRVDNV